VSAASPGGTPGLYGLLAEFTRAEDLVAAARRAREAGYRRMDAYTPFPIEEVAEALHFHDRRLPFVVLCGGVLGALTGIGLQYYVSVVAYPMNVGGKPLFSWPAFVPPTFETTVLLSAFATVIGMIVLNGFPMPYHPVWNNPRFELASQDRFFLCIEADDPRFDAMQTRKFLEAQPNAREVVEVAN
jgi:hypothetical protein